MTRAIGGAERPEAGHPEGDWGLLTLRCIRDKVLALVFTEQKGVLDENPAEGDSAGRPSVRV